MCNCNNSVTTTCYQTCGCNNPCPHTTNCECPVKLNTDCITYNGDDLVCSGIVKGQDLTATLTQLDAYICDAINQISNSFSLMNIGSGVGIYAGIDGLGRKKLKSLTSTGDLIIVSDNTNDVSFSIDELELTSFVDDRARLKAYYVATLPVGIQGDQALVMDALSPMYNSTVFGGGSETVKVYFDGISWKS